MVTTRWLILAWIVLSGTSPRLLAAQSSSDTAAVGRAPAVPPAALWVSLGAGNAHLASMSTAQGAFVGKVTLSVGPVLLAFRGNDAGPFIGGGDGVRDNGLLAGVRTGGRRLFGSAALGFANASHYHQCDGCGVTTEEPSVGVMTYDVTAHANVLVVGAAASFSGIVGPARVRYHVVTLGFEAGWFGHRPCAHAKLRSVKQVCSIFA